jgi:2-oxoglutarate dehydrogenase E2 component (dihydrolipoamide succinyltransferase)
MFSEGDTAKIGQVLALIAGEGEKYFSQPEASEAEYTEPPLKIQESGESMQEKPIREEALGGHTGRDPVPVYTSVAFLSPVIRKLAREHDIGPSEIQGIPGTGSGGRITKEDLLAYIHMRPLQDLETGGNPPREQAETKVSPPPDKDDPKEFLSPDQIYGTGPSTVEEMDRTRKLIADHMTYSKKVAPHVSSFVEADVTEMIQWRNRIKDEFQHTYDQKLTLTTLILEAVIKALKDHPKINSSVEGYNVIRKEFINIGMATALPDGNLIVPVIQNADKLNLKGLAEKVNDLAERARDNRLLPSEIQGGTFTVTNMGQYNNIAGTPIINQPEVAILAVGSIRKKPGVVDTPEGETIGIRNILILTLSYDHRVVDGALGGSFLNSVGNYLQSFDPERRI